MQDRKIAISTFGEAPYSSMRSIGLRFHLFVCML